MAFYEKPRFWAVSVVAVLGLVIAYMIWQWEVERVEVPAGKFLIQIHRWGTDLRTSPDAETGEPDQIVAPGRSYQGVMLEVLPEGRHFLNPLFWTYEVQDMVSVPSGTCLVLSRKFGRPIPADRLAAGDILARENPEDKHDGERGILRDVLQPGSYRLNRYAYSWNTEPAVEIRVEQVGVRTLKVGKDPRTMPADPERGHYVVPEGYRGVQQATVPPGTYYINPFVETITPVEVRSHRVELQDIAFPSRDGFILKPQVVVEYAVIADKAAELMVRLTDAELLHQRDGTEQEQQENEILQKVILPHIRGYARIEGSKFNARDFIGTSGEPVAPGTAAPGSTAADPLEAAGTPPTVAATPRTSSESVPHVANAREALQRAMLEKVKPLCQELGVDVRAVTLADMLPPPELAEQIAQRELARVEQEKNKFRVGQYKAEQELKSKEGLKQQAKEKVEAETRLIQAKTKAMQLKSNEESRLTQELENTQIALDAAKSQAEATLAKAKADAEVIQWQNEAEVAGLRKAAQGFDSPRQFSHYQILSRLGPALTEVFASDDSDFARILTSYMTQPTGGPTRPAATAVPVPATPATAGSTP